MTPFHTNRSNGRRFIRLGWPRVLALCLYTPRDGDLRHSSLMIGLYVGGRLWTAIIERRPS